MQASAGKIYLHNEIHYFHVIWKLLLQVSVFLLLGWLGKGCFTMLIPNVESLDRESSKYKGTFKKYNQIKWKYSVLRFPKGLLWILEDSFFVLQSGNTDSMNGKNVTLIFNSNFEKTKVSKQGIQKREKICKRENFKWEMLGIFP